MMMILKIVIIYRNNLKYCRGDDMVKKNPNARPINCLIRNRFG